MAATKKRRWCPTCRNTKFVDGPVKVLDGRSYPTMSRCPDCAEQKPAVVLARGQLPLDHQEKAAGEKRD